MSLSLRSYLYFFVFGAVGYWIPHIFIQLINVPQPWALYLYTIILPIIVIIMWRQEYKRQREKKVDIGLSLSMVLGIWVFGPLAIAVGTMPSGGNFLNMGNIPGFLKMWIAFPVSTMSMSLYSSSLGGLILTTVVLIALGIYFWIKNCRDRKLT